MPMIRFLQAYGSNAVGDRRDFPFPIAELLVKRQAAEWVTPKGRKWVVCQNPWSPPEPEPECMAVEAPETAVVPRARKRKMPEGGE